jgi:hypothetical protein
MFVAVHGELREGMLHRGEDHAGQEGAQGVVPAGGECVWFWGAVKEHRQLEAPPRRRVIRTGGGGGVQSSMQVQGEGCQLGWHTDAEAGLESAEDVYLESEATTAITN